MQALVREYPDRAFLQRELAALLEEAKDSTTRISALVAAVRSYSQLDRASLQLIDVTEGIESTLVMLAHKLRGGVTVERDYDADRAVGQPATPSAFSARVGLPPSARHPQPGRTKVPAADHASRGAQRCWRTSCEQVSFGMRGWQPRNRQQLGTCCHAAMRRAAN
jgi:hypothetical protein